MNKKSTNYNLIGARIKSARENMHITQEELATLIGCTSQHISVIERGIKIPRLVTFIKIINALHIPPDILLQDNIPTIEIDPCAKEISMLIKSASNNKKQCILRIVKILLEDDSE